MLMLSVYYGRVEKNSYYCFFRSLKEEAVLKKNIGECFHVS